MLVTAKKKRGERGPTDLKKLWSNHEPGKKLQLVYNHLGQPCGRKTSKFVNLIGYLVKGKDVSMAAPNWRKVPLAEKEKLWESIKVTSEHSSPLTNLQKHILQLFNI
jgi:hypothetical protein